MTGMSGPQSAKLGSAGQQSLLDFTILQALHQLPDGAALTTAEAAIFLRASPTTLERMRRAVGGGPAYIQGGVKGAKGTNQKVTYLKADLIAYQSEMKVRGSMAAAVRKGQTQGFLAYVDPTPKRSRFDLVTKLAFFASDGCLLGRVDEAPIGVVLQGIGTAEYVWHSPIKAAAMSWCSSCGRERFATEVRRALTMAMDRVGRSSTVAANEAFVSTTLEKHRGS